MKLGKLRLPAGPSPRPPAGPSSVTKAGEGEAMSPGRMTGAVIAGPGPWADARAPRTARISKLHRRFMG
jgi:hypothetical protein